MTDAADFDGPFQCNAKFLAELPGQRRLGGFAGLNLATWELPFQRGGVVAATLSDENAAIVALDDCGNDSDHPVRRALRISLASSRTPRKSGGPGVFRS